MSFQYVRPTDAASAARWKAANPESVFIAGGSCVVDLLSQNVLHPAMVIDLTGLADKDITVNDSGGLRIGALTTMGELAWHETVGQNYPVLMQALLSGATPQVHNAATIGGNLLQKTRCSYFRNPGYACNKRRLDAGCSALEGVNTGHAIFGGSERCVAVHPSDLAVALTALDSELTLQGQSARRKLSIADLYTLPEFTPQTESVLAADELIVEIEIPASRFAAKSAYAKVDEHNSYSFAVVSVAAAVHMEGNLVSEIRLVAGGVAPKPWRLTGAEVAVLNQPLNTRSIEAAATAAIQGAAPLAHNAHKVELLRRTVLGVLGQLGGLQ